MPNRVNWIAGLSFSRGPKEEVALKTPMWGAQRKEKTDSDQTGGVSKVWRLEFGFPLIGD